ncbi:ATP-binding cassette domain-containing protein [Ensifer sp. ENS06]|uniref:ATP-binding cassette domain-containing protein n=1 Tax=Ensifer sp. ENS06 TaxID=2769276 RepID=UPI000DDE736D|nr:ATP-binding cassette domain-containing protein [Ensifer sp. ENS06]MBD9624677.1 ATP-binding cassette domain-containing protein [Ensifer sp. ENS06]
MIQIQNLQKRYGSLEVLKGIDLSAKAGEVVALIGASGSGKSTLLRCINFLETPTSGEVTVLGETLRFQALGGFQTDAERLRRLRARIGMVFQGFNLWSGKTILENALEAPIYVHGVSKREAVRRAEHYLAKVGLYDKRNRYPEELSGGQQQRAAIARALCGEPELMLFDEPTSALDPELVGEVLRVMQMLADEGRTMVVVTHEMAFARDVSSKTVFLASGRIEETGHPTELFARPSSKALRDFLRKLH